jgi:hypothetical protein
MPNISVEQWGLSLERAESKLDQTLLRVIKCPPALY